MNLFVNEKCHKNYRARPNQLRGIQSARWKAQNSAFSDPYSPGATLGVETHCFGPWAQVSPQQAKKQVAKKAPNLNQRRGWLKEMPKRAWKLRGQWVEPVLALGDPLTHNQNKKVH